MNIDIDNFIQERQIEITTLVNSALNRAGDIIQKKISAGDVGATLQDVLPQLLYEVLVTNNVAILRLVSEMINDANAT